MINRFKLRVLTTLIFVTTVVNTSFSQSESANLLASAKTPEITLNIFPNPNRGNFYITLQNSASQEAQLFSLDGRFIKTLYLVNGMNYIDILSMPAGIYVLEVGEGDLKENYKITVK